MYLIMCKLKGEDMLIQPHQHHSRLVVQRIPPQARVVGSGQHPGPLHWPYQTIRRSSSGPARGWSQLLTTAALVNSCGHQVCVKRSGRGEGRVWSMRSVGGILFFHFFFMTFSCDQLECTSCVLDYGAHVAFHTTLQSGGALSGHG
jgi:hypothetical protein